MKGLPREARAVWAELVGRPSLEPDALRDALSAYRQQIQVEAERRELFDHALGLKVAGGCEALLGRWEELSEEGRTVAQAAVQYFLRQHDGEDDFESVTGFDDDAAVLNAALVQLGFDDLRLD